MIPGDRDPCNGQRLAGEKIMVLFLLGLAKDKGNQCFEKYFSKGH